MQKLIGRTVKVRLLEDGIASRSAGRQPMLGSAIPRRWVFSLALVGLVTIFAVSYSAVWSDPASAGAGDSQGAGGTGNSALAVKSEKDSLLSANPFPFSLKLQPGQKLNQTIVLIDETNTVNPGIPGVTFQWSHTGGVTVLAGSTSPTAIIQANGSGTVQVIATQIRKNETWVVIRDIAITVTTPSATSTPAAPPSNPGTPPASIPNAQGVVQPVSSILVSSTGVESGSNPENSSLKDRPVVFVRPGSVSGFFGVQVNTVAPSSLPPMPTGFTRGSSATDISFFNASGVKQQNFKLLRSAQVCLPTSSSDRVNGFSNVRVLRLSSTSNQWIPLTSTYNNFTRQVCANSSNFSNFSVGVQQIPATAAPPGTNLPATGGWSPTASLLVLVGLLGAALAGGGTITMLRARNATRPE